MTASKQFQNLLDDSITRFEHVIAKLTRVRANKFNQEVLELGSSLRIAQKVEEERRQARIALVTLACGNSGAGSPQEIALQIIADSKVMTRAQKMTFSLLSEVMIELRNAVGEDKYKEALKNCEARMKLLQEKGYLT